MSRKIKSRLPGGFQDFDTRKCLIKEKVIGIIELVFRSFGFNPIETPLVEFYEALVGRDDTSKNLFQLRTKGIGAEETLGLRFDHTVPFARFLALNPYNKKKQIGISLPWKRSTVGPVFRADKPQQGKYRQFFQFDIDIAGTRLMLADAEIVAVMYCTLKALLKDEEFKIKINNRKTLNGLAEMLGFESKSEKAMQIMRSLDKVEKIGWSGVKEELALKPIDDFDPSPGLDEKSLEIVYQFITISGNNTDKIKKAREVFKGNNLALQGIEELEQILAYADNLGVPVENLVIDFSVARGLGYYTGPVFETEIPRAKRFGSVFSGGRFDDLMQRFSNVSLPAVGASIGVDRLLAVMDYLKLTIETKNTVSEVMILRLGENLDSKYLEILNWIRETGFNVELSFFGDTTWGAQFNYALSRLPGLKYLVIMGGNEIEKGTVQIKNLANKKQEEIAYKEIKKYFLTLKTEKL